MAIKGKAYGYLLGAIAASSFGLNPTFTLPLAGIGIAMTISSLALYVSYNYMAAGIASTILFVYPLIVAIIMAVFYHEKLTMQTILCILLATSGILLLYNVGDGETLSPYGTAVGLAVVPTVISLFCTTKAIQIIGSTPTAILGALEPATAVIMGMLLFREGMTGREAFGILMILIAVSFVIAGGAISGSAIARHLTRIRHMFPKISKNR